MPRFVRPGDAPGTSTCIERAAALHDEVVVAVLHNPAKAGTFTVDERIGFVERALAARGLADRVRVEAFAERLLVDVCRELDADVVVKGVRGPSDVTYEWPMALMNRHLTGVETLFLPGRPGLRARLELAGEGGRALGWRRDRSRPGRGARRARRPPACRPLTPRPRGTSAAGPPRPRA